MRQRKYRNTVTSNVFLTASDLKELNNRIIELTKHLNVSVLSFTFLLEGISHIDRFFI